jgi:uncharacterized protein YhhL (DUF1145 family)
MESNDVLLYSIIALIIWAVIIYNIIQSASKSNKIELQLKMQTLLLAKMAQKAGVSDEDVNKIINLKQ